MSQLSTKSLILFLFSFYFFLSCQKKEGLSVDKKIMSFSFSNIPTALVVINEEQKRIDVTIPYNTGLQALNPIVVLSEGATVIPASGKVQNFSAPVYYTVTALDGSKVIYTVVVKNQPQPIPQILKFSSDTIEAGKELLVSGKFFGNFPLDIKTQLINPKNESFDVDFTYIDSTNVRIKIPIGQAVDSYKLALKVKNQQTTSTQALRVSYPSPQLSQLIKHNILQGDTIWVDGKYLQPSNYKYQLLLSNSGKTSVLSYTLTKGTYYGFKTNNTLLENTYDVKIHNQTENKTSVQTNHTLQIYDANKPFVSGIINFQPNYIKGSKILFKTLNMNQNTARFIQFSLLNKDKSYYQNGIFDAKTNQIQLDLPTTINVGTYTLNVSLINSAGTIFQTINLDNELIVK